MHAPRLRREAGDVSALSRVKACLVVWGNAKTVIVATADLREVVRLAEQGIDSPFDEPCKTCGGPHSDYDHEPARRPLPKVAQKRTRRR